LGDGGVKTNSLTVMFLIASEALIGLYITVIVIASFISVLTAKKDMQEEPVDVVD
jgi:hypothetical protein